MERRRGRAARDHRPPRAGDAGWSRTLTSLEAHGAPRAERPVLQLVRPPHRREADDLAADRRAARRRSCPRSTTAGSPSACGSWPTACRRSPRRAGQLYDSMDFGFYYRPDVNRILFHYVPDTGAAPCCYDTLREREPDRDLHRDRQGRDPGRRPCSAPTARSRDRATGAGPRRSRSATRTATSARASTTARCRYNGTLVTPSWGGSMFEALMPSLFVPEERWAPRQLGSEPPADRRRADPPWPAGGRLRLLGLLAGEHSGGRLRRVRRRRDRQQPGRLPSNEDSTGIDHGWPGLPRPASRTRRRAPTRTASSRRTRRSWRCATGRGAAIADLRKLERDFPVYTPLGFLRLGERRQRRGVERVPVARPGDDHGRARERARPRRAAARVRDP